MSDVDPGLETLAVRVSERTGLRFDGPRRPHLLGQLAGAAARAGISDLNTYAKVLDQGPPELLDGLIASVTVAETYFFREPRHFELLRQQIPALLARPGRSRPLTVWSAGCATGEEAYSLAIVLAEQGCPDARVLATDLSAASLRQARQAVYGPRSLRGVDDRRRAFFGPRGGAFTVPERFRRMVTFQVRNLADPREPPTLPGIRTADVIFCRNALMYLSPAGLATAAAQLAASLAPDGWLVTASSDPDLAGRAELAAFRTPWGVAYRHPLPGVASDPPAPVAPPVRRRQPAASTRPAAAMSHRPAAALQSSTSTATADEIRTLGDAGQLTAAMEAAELALRADPLNYDLRHLHAVALLAAGRWVEAEAEARATVYLAPHRPEAHAVLGHARSRLGRARTAARSLRTAAVLAEAAEPGPHRG